MKVVIPWSFVTGVTRNQLFRNKNHSDDITRLPSSYFLKIYEKRPKVSFQFSEMFSFISWFHMNILVEVTGMTYFIVRELKNRIQMD